MAEKNYTISKAFEAKTTYLVFSNEKWNVLFDSIFAEYQMGSEYYEALIKAVAAQAIVRDKSSKALPSPHVNRIVYGLKKTRQRMKESGEDYSAIDTALEIATDGAITAMTGDAALRLRLDQLGLS